jgi:hypothetical protein
MDTNDRSGSKVPGDTPSAENDEASHTTSCDGQSPSNVCRNSSIPVSPGILLALAVAAAVFTIAAGVAIGVASHSQENGWQVAHAILPYVSSAVYVSGILVGLATLVTAGRVPTGTPSAENDEASHTTSCDGQSPSSGRYSFVLVCPDILLGLAAAAAVLAIANGVVNYVAYQLNANGWQVADSMLGYVSTAVYVSGILVGLGTLATARTNGVSTSIQRMVHFLLLGGVAVVVLGIIQVVCINVGELPYGGLPYASSHWYIAGWVFSLIGSTLFYAGILEGLAYLCLRQANHLKSSIGEPLQKPGD